MKFHLLSIVIGGVNGSLGDLDLVFRSGRGHVVLVMATSQVVLEVADGEELLAAGEGAEGVLGPPWVTVAVLLVSGEILFL